MRGISAIAFSGPVDADMDTWNTCIAQFTSRLVAAAKRADYASLLNVNFPKATPVGVRVSHVGRQVYEENVIPRRDPGGREYFWIGGRVTEGGEHDGTDAHAVALGYVSVTPLALEATNREHWALAAEVAGHSSDGT